MALLLNKILGFTKKNRKIIRRGVSDTIENIFSDFNASSEPLGLDDNALKAFSSKYRLTDISSRFKARGDSNNLAEIAWWGSVLGDIGCSNKEKFRQCILEEAALFNLSVALFDSAYDEKLNGVERLINSLTPDRLNNILLSPEPTLSLSTSNDHNLFFITNLFNVTLTSIRKRMKSNYMQLSFLSELLKLMYESELCISQDPFAAKRLPVVFAGSLSDNYEKNYPIFTALAFFINLWDDWQDLPRDLKSSDPNYFLPNPQNNLHRAFTYWSSPISKNLSSSRFQEHIISEMRISLGKIFYTVDGVFPERKNKVVAFLKCLTGN